MVEPTSLDNPPRPIPELAVMSDASGRYSWSLPPGRYSLVAKAVPGTTKDLTHLTVGRFAPVVVVVTAGHTVTVDLPLSR